MTHEQQLLNDVGIERIAADLNCSHAEAREVLADNGVHVPEEKE